MSNTINKLIFKKLATALKSQGLKAPFKIKKAQIVALTFDKWLEEIDTTLRNEINRSIGSYPNVQWKDLYEEGVTVEEVTEYLIRMEVKPANHSGKENIY